MGSLVKCHECGAVLPGPESCAHRFERLLARDNTDPEARAVHGLMVAAYLTQHPSDVRAGTPGMKQMRLRALHEATRPGADAHAVLREWATRRARTVEPLPAQLFGETTIASIDPEAKNGHAERVRAWALSVADRYRAP